MKSATEKLVEPSDTMDDSLEGQDAELTSSPIYPGFSGRRTVSA